MKRKRRITNRTIKKKATVSRPQDILVEAALAHKMTFSDVGKHLQVSRSTVTGLVNGRLYFTPHIAAGLVELFGVPVAAWRGEQEIAYPKTYYRCTTCNSEFAPSRCKQRYCSEICGQRWRLMAAKRRDSPS